VSADEIWLFKYDPEKRTTSQMETSGLQN